MKKILLFIALTFIFLSCEKKKEIEPIKFDNVNIELFGAFAGWYGFTGEIEYTLNININGLNHYIDISEILEPGFVGTIYKNQIRLKTDDILKISISNNNYPDVPYVYLRIYTHISRKQKIEFEQYKEFNISIIDNYFRDIEIE